jgi:putative ABC transport system permease protein
MGTLLQDIRYGLRMLWKHPGFTIISVLALALGIGANSAIFTVVNAVLLRPLPFEQPERLVTVLSRNEREATVSGSHSYLNFTDLRDQNQVFDSVGAYTASTFFFIGNEGPERVNGALLSADMFAVLRARPALGRAFTREEDQLGAKRVAVISHNLWQRRFGGDSKVLGQDVTIGSTPATIIGVMPKGFRFPISMDAECWMALTPALNEGIIQSRGAVFLGVVARMKEGVSIEQAQAESTTIASRLAAQYPDSNAGQGIALQSTHERVVGDLRPALLVILSAVGFVLLIACANVANLLLARASSRHKEIAIRTAMGASRGRIIRQLLTESLMLSLMGGAAGLLLALWGVDLLVAATPADIPRVSEVGLDARVLAFTAGVTLLTGLFFGLAPALQASKSDLNEGLKEGGRGSTESLRSNRVRSTLVVVEVALSLVLLVGAGLLIQSFWRLLEVKPGFDPEKVLAADVSLLRKDYPRTEQYVTFYQEAIERLGAMAGVEAAGAVDPLPLSNSFEAYSFQVEGRPASPPGEEPGADFRIASPGYFRAMGIPLVKGRIFNERDTMDTPHVILISEAFARRFFPNEEPLGKRLQVGDGQSRPREIIGIVGDVRHAGLDQEPEPEFYVSYLQKPTSSMSVVVRASGADPAALAPSLRGVIGQINKDQPVYNVRTMRQLLSESVARRRFNMLLLGVFAGVALLLAAIGLYGVMSYSVTRRTHELGIRIALGAQAGDVLRLVVGQGMTLALIGVVAGLVAAYFATRAMATLLFGVGTTDLWTFAGVALLISAVAFLASYLPARRATKVDPMVALRYE